MFSTAKFFNQQRGSRIKYLFFLYQDPGSFFLFNEGGSTRVELDGQHVAILDRIVLALHGKQPVLAHRLL